MKTKLNRFFSVLALLALCTLNLQLSTTFAQGTAFTYQGRVLDNGTSFTGAGQFEFALVTSTNTSSQATATVNLSGTFVTSYNLTYGGGGYLSAPSVTISGGGGTGATATATISGGVVTGITPGNAGTGYTSTPTVTIAAPPANITYTTYWSNDGTSVNGSEPSASVSVSVSNGLFTVVLGQNMMAIPATIFASAPNLQLRIWFNDGVNGFAALSPLQNLTSTPYAIQAVNANSASNLLGTLPAAQLIGTLPTSQLAGTIPVSQLTGIIPLAQLPGAVLTNNETGVTVGGTFAGNGGGLTNLNASDLNSGVVPRNVLPNFQASDNYAAIGGGIQNTSSASYSVVGGGTQNTASGTDSTVGGGFNNTADKYSTVSGGYQNSASGIAFGDATVGGGTGNHAANDFATIGGGQINTASGSMATIGGGLYNTASGLYATIGGGIQNTNSSQAGAVGGGHQNIASANYATIPGGFDNLASGNYSFAAGQQAQATNQGAFVWADSQTAPFASTTNDSFNVRAKGGVRFVTGGAGMTLDGQPVFTGNSGASFWRTNGNAGANPTNGSFLGSIDNLPLEIRANNLRALRIEPGGASTNLTFPGILGGDGGPDTTPTGAPNMIGGAWVNFVAGAVGSTIAGGGAPYYGEVTITGPAITYINSVTGDFGTVSGGAQNTSGYEATVGGGFQNTAGSVSTVSGGTQNTAANGGFIGGGNSNIATNGGTIAGGFDNNASGEAAFIGGGVNNTNAGDFTTVGGGYGNSAGGTYATVAGGSGNTAGADNATVAGGLNNFANRVQAVVGGGFDNIAVGLNATIAGGSANYVSGQSATIGGGSFNTNSGSYAVISGGDNNFATGTGATVSGEFNSVRGNYSTIGGGLDNTNTSAYAVIPGGYKNLTGAQLTFAAGYYAQAVNQGTFVWSDSEGIPFTSTGNDQFLLRAHGGIGIDTASTPDSFLCINTNTYLFSHALYLRGEIGSDHNHGLAYNGNTVTNFGTGQYQVDGPALWGYSGGVLGTKSGSDHGAVVWSTTGVSVYGTFNNNSDRNAKQDFATVTPAEILDKVAQLPVSEWCYKVDASTRHIGPMAQDFYATFNIGTDDKHIAPIDEGGVALAAIQGLNQKLEADAKAKDAEIESLKQGLAELKQMVQSLAEKK